MPRVATAPARTRVRVLDIIPSRHTIWQGIGIDEDGVERKFVGDRRPMSAIVGHLVAGEEVYADVPAWAIGWEV